jgi:hypothetical protein
MRKEKVDLIQRHEESGNKKSKLYMQMEALEKQVQRLSQDKIDQELSIKAKQRLIDSHVENELDLRSKLTRCQDDLHKLEKSHDELKEADRKR